MTSCKKSSKDCFERFIASSFIQFIKRIIPLMQAIWMYVDMILDVRQTYIYHDHAFNPDGKYSKWALKAYHENAKLGNNQTINDNLELVHPGYFYTAIVSWILPPFLYSAECSNLIYSGRNYSCAFECTYLKIILDSFTSTDLFLYQF